MECHLKGTEFEILIRPFFEAVFLKMGFIVYEIRNQTSGTQNGFDIKIIFADSSNNKRHLYIECKYYKSKLNWADIFRKQLELYASNYEVDGFILISPFVNLSNIDDNLQNQIEENCFKFPADFWTPDKGIKELFTLDPKLYKKNIPRRLSSECR